MGEKKYDVWITHAYEDKDSFVNELALALKDEGARIWYSGFDLGSGDSITENVAHALSDSKFGVMIISPAYLQKVPAMNELNALLAKNKHQRIIPVLHNLTANQVAGQLPLLSNEYSINSSEGLDHVVSCILQIAIVKIEKKNKGIKSMKDENAGVIVLGGNTSSKNIIGNEPQGGKERT